MASYCENCSVVFEGDRCPACGSKKVREAGSEDKVFLVEKEQLWSPMLKDVLDQNGIPCLCRNVKGAGLALKLGMMSERVRFYVLYKDLDKAKDIVSELFADDSGKKTAQSESDDIKHGGHGR